MQHVVMGLNPEAGPDYIAVYLDDILVFSRSLVEHRNHLKQVFKRIEEVELKLNPKKCLFDCQRVEYLRNVITAQGLKPNLGRIEAVKHYKVPHNLHIIRQFLVMLQKICTWLCTNYQSSSRVDKEGSFF